MDGAGLYTESAKGECNLGQLEVGFRYADILSTCDNHVVYKLGAKQIADQEGKSVTFMAKPNEREGSSCHIHLSLNDSEGKPAFPTGHGTEMSETMKHFRGRASWTPNLDFTPTLRTSTPTNASPMAPSPRPLSAGAGTTAHARCALSVMCTGCASNSESPEPTQTHTSRARPSSPPASTGWRTSLEPPEAPAGNAYTQDVPHIPRRLHDAVAAFDSSAVARNAFGDEVVDHYAHAGRVEMAAFDAAVTDWEVKRGFERL